jgi:hypothetical protein
VRYRQTRPNLFFALCILTAHTRIAKEHWLAGSYGRNPEQARFATFGRNLDRLKSDVVPKSLFHRQVGGKAHALDIGDFERELGE